MPDLDQISGIPIYVQIRERILAQIQNNEIGMGDKLPTEEEMAHDLGVSRMTVRRAIEDLVDEGLLQRKRGIGTFVVAKKMTRHYTDLTSFYEEAMEQGLQPSSVVLSLKIIPATPEIAGYLNIKPGALVHQVKRLRLLNKEPIALHIAHIPCHLIDTLDKGELESQSLYHIYNAHRLPAQWAKQRIEAHIANEELAEYLDLEVGAPILYSARTTYTIDDAPVEWVQGYSSGAGYAVEFTMTRSKSFT